MGKYKGRQELAFIKPLFIPVSHPAQACPRNLTEGDGKCRKDNRQKTKHA
jgi:hypothetical protein